MKLKKWMYLGGLFVALVTGRLAQADTIVAEPVKLFSQNQSEKIETFGQFKINLEENFAKFILETEGQAFQTVKADVWTLEDKSDLVELPLEMDETGRFTADFRPELKVGISKYFVQLIAVSTDERVYEVKDYSFEWQVDALPSTTTEEVTSSSTTEASTQWTSTEETSTSQKNVEESKTVTALEEAAEGKLTVQNHNLTAGTFDVIVSNLSSTSGIKAVKIPVWTEEGGQDDIRWYTAIRQSNGSYKITINKKNHKNGQGIYHIHLYYENDAGKLIGVSSTTTHLSITGNLTIANVNPTTGKFDVVIKDVLSPYAINSIRVPVWTEEGGQDDIRWYTATRRTDGSYTVSIDKKNHKNGSGIYNVHLYYEFNNAPLQGVASTQTSLSVPTSGKISVSNHNTRTGSFDVIVSDVTSSKTIKAVKIPVWTEEGGQDDIIWYVAKRQSDGTYKVTVNKKNHKNGQGIYHIHLYYENDAGKLIGVSSTTTHLSITGNLTIANVNPTTGKFDVVIKDVLSPYAIKSVKVPVWTEEGGQDDIRWYTATRRTDGSYTVSIDKKNHKNGSGIYNVHLYYEFNNAPLQGVASTQTSLSVPTSGKISVSNHNTRTGSFDVIVSDVTSSKTLKAVKIPVWTEEGGQDDIIWYVAKRQSDGTYKVTVNNSNHKNRAGFYNVHLYYEYSDGNLQGIGSTRTALSNQGSIKVTNLNVQAGSFDLIISDVAAPSIIKSVKVPVWTEEGGQDDIQWYTATKQANGTYKVTVKKSNHKNGSGIYQAHLYYEFSNGQLAGIASTTASLTIKSAGKLSVVNIDKKSGTFEVLISNPVFASTPQSVQVPVWTEEGGQDDIRWYTATKQNDGNYRVKVDSKNHKYGRGTYQVHLYFNFKNGVLEGIASTKFTLPEQEAAAKISITNRNNEIGSFDVVISDIVAPKGLEAVQVPVWSEKNGQDDIIWYLATKQANGTYKVKIEASKHSYDTGTYHAHLYLKQKDGSTIGVAQTKTNVSISQTKPQANVSIQNVDNNYGVFDIVVSNIFAPAGVTKVQVPVWSSVNGQNDIIWYEAYKQADGNYRVTVRLANHRYETGTYNAHVYIESKGQTHFVNAATADVRYTKKSGQAFIDISSHNGRLSVADYRALMVQGVSGVVVKLTEGTTYTNPYAAEQIRNAQAVGLKVSVYHYSHFTSAATAQAEARYFSDTAKKLGLPNTTLMVNDIEEDKSRNNINANMKSWEAEMRRLGFNNLIHYTGASWIDVNNLGYSGPIKTGEFGISNFWVAQYPYLNGMSAEQARLMAYHAAAAAWQFTSRAVLLIGRPFFDLNIDYSGRFTN